MDMAQSNWLEATGQMWKLYLALFSCVIALLAFPFAVIALITGQMLVMPYWVSGAVLSTVTVLWVVWSLRCPTCERSLAWKMFKTRPHMTWLVDLVGLDRCPYCAHSLRRRCVA